MSRLYNRRDMRAVESDPPATPSEEAAVPKPKQKSTNSNPTKPKGTPDGHDNSVH